MAGLVAAFAMWGLAAAPAWALPSTTGTPPQLVSISGPPATVDLEQVDGARWRLHITDDAGVVSGEPQDPDSIDTVSYLAVGPAGTTGDYVLWGTRVSGTDTDGVWDFGPFAEPNPFGSWALHRVHLVSSDGDTVDLYPSLPTFKTISRYGAFYHAQPASDAQTVVAYGRSVTIAGKLQWFFDGVGHPIPRVTVTFWEKVPAVPTFPDGDETKLGTATTDANGSFTFRYVPKHNAFRIYFVAPEGTTPNGFRYLDSIGWTGRIWAQLEVNLWAHSPSAPVGTVIPLNGNVLPNHAGQYVYLQRWTRTGWKTVSSAPIRSSGRWTLTAQPPVRGVSKYRVDKPSDADHRGSTTAVFGLTGT